MRFRAWFLVLLSSCGRPFGAICGIERELQGTGRLSSQRAPSGMLLGLWRIVRCTPR